MSNKLSLISNKYILSLLTLDVGYLNHVRYKDSAPKEFEGGNGWVFSYVKLESKSGKAVCNINLSTRKTNCMVGLTSKRLTVESSLSKSETFSKFAKVCR